MSLGYIKTRVPRQALLIFVGIAHTGRGCLTSSKCLCLQGLWCDQRAYRYTPTKAIQCHCADHTAASDLGKMFIRSCSSINRQLAAVNQHEHAQIEPLFPPAKSVKICLSFPHGLGLSRDHKTQGLRVHILQPIF